MPVRSLHLKLSLGWGEIDQLDFKGERGVGRDDITSACGTVGVIRRASEDSLLSLLQLHDSLVPASDDLLNADYEVEGLAAGDGGVEDSTVGELASVVDLDS